MTKGRFLTRRWNNRLTLGLGLLTLAYVVLALSTSILSEFAAFVGIAVLSAVY
jgi:hypothetical protein